MNKLLTIDEVLDSLYKPGITDIELLEYHNVERPVIYLDDAKGVMNYHLEKLIAAERLDAFGAGIRFGLNQLDDMMLGNITGQYPVEYVKNMINTVLKINEIPKPGIHDQLTHQANGETK